MKIAYEFSMDFLAGPENTFLRYYLNNEHMTIIYTHTQKHTHTHILTSTAVYVDRHTTIRTQ